ncbi:phage tail protein [Pseudomonas kielensis]|uniref:phage tail protein n=1 Tax=Pseudomonas kielensis TaxID=2762577 RepID=UPI0022404E1F|nr:phage tail protein [Pseudomonas kielensis]UZM16227.1 phage tail protein [Pseudomonas kielensis]
MIELAQLHEPEVSHRFLATFFFKGMPSPLDIRFHRISGLGKGVLGFSPHTQGGVNANNLYLPERVSHPPLVLERGVMVLTPLSLAFDSVLSGMDTAYVDAVIMLLNHQSLPVCTWTVTDALPVKWQTGDLDAASNAPLINRIELVYRDIQWMGAKA